VVIGLSGGIDSAVTAALACEALGADHVHGVAMPSRHSSTHSIADARALAENFGIDFRIIPLEPAHTAFEAMLAPAFEGRSPDVTEENLQARIRGVLLMALSNKFGWLVLSTGNKSEVAVGYSTLYGDSCGGLAVIADVPKTDVYRLAHSINQRAGRELIPASSITKPPSAELRPGQLDQDSLPPYDVLDRILEGYVEQNLPFEELVAYSAADARTVARVLRMVDRNEYKRQQLPPNLRVTSKAFGYGRRMPIAQHFSAES
jgi:NAD+ synthase (glutamine-hydrolysing)